MVEPAEETITVGEGTTANLETPKEEPTEERTTVKRETPMEEPAEKKPSVEPAELEFPRILAKQGTSVDPETMVKLVVMQTTKVESAELGKVMSQDGKSNNFLGA